MSTVQASAPHPQTGYKSFELGAFSFSRDEYFVTISWPAREAKLSHIMPVDAFLKALMRDVSWGFFYGWVNFDAVLGTRNRYGNVELYAGRYNDGYHDSGLDYVETFETPHILDTFKAVLSDWTNAGFDPFAAPAETGTTVFGKKNGDNIAAIERNRETCRRMPGLPNDASLRSDDNGYPINRAFADVDQDEPEVQAEPGFENEVHAMNLFKYLSRSDVTWNPSVVSVCRNSLFCPTTEEHMLPIIHGNDRVEWFIQLSDQITWQVGDKETGRPRARVIMNPGDVAAMPAGIRHQGFSPKRAMLLVWENATPGLPDRYNSGELSPYPIKI